MWVAAEGRREVFSMAQIIALVLELIILLLNMFGGFVLL